MKWHHGVKVLLCYYPILVCVNVTETNTFTSTVTSKTYKIDHKFDCDENCLVYLLMCEHCSQYLVCWTMVTSITNGIIIKITVENTHVMKIVCKNICMVTICLVIKIFLIQSQ